jgi:hypothetical protein
MLDALRREGAGWAEDGIRELGRPAGSAQAQEWGRRRTSIRRCCGPTTASATTSMRWSSTPAWHELMTSFTGWYCDGADVAARMPLSAVMGRAARCTATPVHPPPVRTACPVCTPIRTPTAASYGHRCAASVRCTCSAHATARVAPPNTKEPIAQRVHLIAAMGGDRRADQPPVLGQHLRIPLPQGLDQPHRPLDVAEQEGDHPVRQPAHSPPHRGPSPAPATSPPPHLGQPPAPTAPRRPSLATI